jgi:hypothetical protein
MPPPTIVVVVEVVVTTVVVLADVTVVVVVDVEVVVDVLVVVVGKGQLAQRWRTFRDVSLHDKVTSLQSFLSSLLRVATASLRIARSVARHDATASRVASHFPRLRGTSVRHSA